MDRTYTLCPNVLTGCAHTMVVNERGEIIGCAEYVPLNAWQIRDREAMAGKAMGKALNLRMEADYMVNYLTPTPEVCERVGMALVEADMWSELHTFLMKSLPRRERPMGRRTV